MRFLFLALALLAVLGCAPTPNRTTDDLVRVWAARTNSVEQVASAVNAHFTNGTPISYIVSILGRNDSTLRPFSAIDPNTGRTPTGMTCSLIYQFGEDSVYINTTAPINADPLPYAFAGAGYTLHVKGTGQIVSGGGQPVGAANGSQPIRSETNSTSGEAGSRR